MARGCDSAELARLDDLPDAADYGALEELAVLLELWALCGHKSEYLPPWPLWRRAAWARARIAAYEGRRLSIPAEHAIGRYVDPPDEGCGVRPFA